MIKNMKIAAALAALVCGLAARAEGPRPLRLATTTSTDNSGLLQFLLPEFESSLGVKVHVIAAGTGQALKLAENGDVDLVMVHSPEAEERFVDAGFGVNRRPFMKNDFVLVGPEEDPAGIRSAGSLEEALGRLTSDPKAMFVSRGDESGTHVKEKALWAEAKLAMPPGRYLSIGQGMEAALRMAHEKRAYTLSDRGTYLARKDSFKLTIVFENDPRLDNPYAVIAVNPARYPDANYMDAMLLIAWLTSPDGQKKIASFTAGGETLFFPTAVPR